LAQLGLKIQHALRAFTANDRKVIKESANNFPETAFFKTDEILTSMGIGEALVTCLNEKGIPSPLAVTYMCPPRSRMDILSDAEIKDLVTYSNIHQKYTEEIDRESAYEILSKKLDAAVENKTDQPELPTEKKGKSTLETILASPLTKHIGRTAANIITRSLLGALGMGGKSTKKWF
jgi:uncharacterized protein